MTTQLPGARRFPTLLAVTVGPALLTACPSYTMLQTPQTVETGETRFTLAPGALGGAVPEIGGGALPTFEFGIKHGINEKSDFGARVYLLGFALDYKYQLLDSPTLDVSLAPNVSAFFAGAGGSGGGVAYLHLPVLLGINMGDTVTFVVGPRVTALTALGGSGGAGTVQVGSGFGLHLALSETFSIMPEFTVMKVVAGSEGASLGGVAFQGGLGFNFGGPLSN